MDCRQLIRRHIAGRTTLGRQAEEENRRGIYVGNQVTLQMVQRQLEELNASSKGYIVHGFPLSMAQAEVVAFIWRIY